MDVKFVVACYPFAIYFQIPNICLRLSDQMIERKAFLKVKMVTPVPKLQSCVLEGCTDSLLTNWKGKTKNNRFLFELIHGKNMFIQGTGAFINV